MILQNITKAIREQNYYAVALEFVIVIAGVVQTWIAFQYVLERFIQDALDAVDVRLVLLQPEARP